MLTALLWACAAPAEPPGPTPPEAPSLRRPPAPCRGLRPEACVALCETDAPEACAEAGAMLFILALGDGAKIEKAGALWQRGCDADQGPACFELGAHIQIGQGFRKDEEGARALLDKGCRLHDIHACRAFGLMLANGQGGPADPREGLARLDAACVAGDEAACADARALR